MYTVVQVIMRCDDDADYDLWVDICLELLPKTKAAALRHMLELFDKSGVELKGHMQIWQTEADVDHGLTEDEVKQVKLFDISDYEGYALAPKVPCIISGRYILRF